jgi:hypothetical protein
VGEHVDVAEGRLPQLLGRRRVREQCPVGTRDFDIAPCVVPKAAHLVDVLCPIETLNRRLIAPVKRLLQEPCGGTLVSGNQDRFFVDDQIREAFEVMPP